ncbi:SGNH/GDSL hydrolase family protein [Methylocella sp.]|uniref:SGNH/GDSL hydrolase family protein n=1 Tax=Methylocella sp. TaxID=1978226 RepID=UPI003784A782
MGDFVPAAKAGETIYAKLRRMAADARRGNPHLIDPTTGLPALLPAAQAPTINLAPGYANTAAVVAAGYSQAIPAASSGVVSSKFAYTGGWPIVYASSYVRVPSVTQYSTGNGSAANNPPLNAMAWRVHFRTDAPIVVIAAVGNTPFRLLVNGQYVSLASSTMGASTPAFATLDFSSVGGRAMRDVAIEMWAASSFYGVWLKPVDSFEKKSWADPIRAAYYGDSITTGTAATYVGDCFAHVCGDALGIPDNWQIGVGSTGYGVGVANTSYAAEAHVFDITQNCQPDVVFLTHNVNSYQQAATGALSWANVARPGFLSVYSQIRAWRPTVPIFQIGVLASYNSALDTYAVPYETAQKADVQAFAQSDPNLFYVPITTSEAPWVAGSGNSTALANNGNRDVLYDQAGPHPNTKGHQHIGLRLAAGALAAIAGKA